MGTDDTPTSGSWSPTNNSGANMTTLPKPSSLATALTCTWDAWNRLVEVKQGAVVVGRYEYDGLGRRAKSHVDSQSPASPNGVDAYVHFFYNQGWQELESRRTTSENTGPESVQPQYQYVWSRRYLDAPVLRDKNTDADGLCDDERIYYLGDANFNITTLVSTAGDAVERYVYSPYGVLTIYDATWANVRSASSYANAYTYTGRQLDTETGLYYYRARLLHAQLGRFVSRDPIGYDGGETSAYLYIHGAPLTRTDAGGTCPGMPVLLRPIVIPRPAVVPRPPIPIMERPPLPGTEPSYPPLPDPDPVPQQPDPGTPAPPGEGVRPPGDCSQQEYEQLRQQVIQHCKTPPPSACTGNTLLWSCDDFQNAAWHWGRCAKARQDLDVKCFRGGNAGHIYQRQMAFYYENMCWYKYHWWRCGGWFNNPFPEDRFMITSR